MESTKYILAIFAAALTAIIAGTAYNKLPEHALAQAIKLGKIQSSIDTLQTDSKAQNLNLEQQNSALLAALERAKQAEDSLRELEATLSEQKTIAETLNRDLEFLVDEVTGPDGIAGQDKLVALREFVAAIQDDEAGAKLLQLQNDVSEIKGRKTPGSSNKCQWISISNPTGGHRGAIQGKEWTASCPAGHYVKSYGLNTWVAAATYHHKMECCSFTN